MRETIVAEQSLDVKLVHICNVNNYNNISFYRVALNARRSSYEKAVSPSVRPSVCLSVKRLHSDKMEERSV